jgi:RNA polymerase sigma-70 factor, ECF subfamily
VVVLRFFLELSLPETAAALGIPIGTVKSRLHRSLAQMRIDVTSDDVTPTATPEGRYA